MRRGRASVEDAPAAVVTASGSTASVAAVHPAKYSLAQKEAIAAAYEHLSASGVVELAAAGRLTHPSGATLGPFATTQGTVRSTAARARRRHERDAAAAKASALPPRDGVERLRRDIADAIERKVRSLEIEESYGRQVSGEEIRQAARALRELAALPGPDERWPPAPPGAKRNGRRQGGETRGGLAGRILAEHRQRLVALPS